MLIARNIWHHSRISGNLPLFGTPKVKELIEKYDATLVSYWKGKGDCNGKFPGNVMDISWRSTLNHISDGKWYHQQNYCYFIYFGLWFLKKGSAQIHFKRNSYPKNYIIPISHFQVTLRVLVQCENVFHLQVHGNANHPHFHKKDFAYRLVMKQRHKITWKWPIEMLPFQIF